MGGRRMATSRMYAQQPVCFCLVGVARGELLNNLGLPAALGRSQRQQSLAVSQQGSQG